MWVPVDDPNQQTPAPNNLDINIPRTPGTTIDSTKLINVGGKKLGT